VLSRSRQYFAKNVCFWETPNNANTQRWVPKTVWQQIPGRRAHKALKEVVSYPDSTQSHQAHLTMLQ